MSTVAWRRFLLALCALTAIVTGVGTWMQVAVVSLTDFRVATETHFVDRINVSPTSRAYRAGLRTGDLVDLRQLSVEDRYRWVTSVWRRDEPMQVPVLRRGAIHSVSVTAVPFGFTWDIWLATVGILWMLLFAALIAWRRAESPELVRSRCC
jgi:hypothetical protein